MDTPEQNERGPKPDDTPKATGPTASDLASMGGKARAESLSPERRSEIARAAVEARWGKEYPLATHGDEQHPLRFGQIAINCYVLEDGRRVLHQRGMLTAIGIKQGGRTKTGGPGDRLMRFVGQETFKSFAKNSLAGVIAPFKFRTPMGALALGYEASILADICDMVLAARRAGRLSKQQAHIADQCEILLAGFARVGIIAMVDAATGYEDVRDRQALQAILDKYLMKTFATWAKRFGDDFYREIFRLRGWEWKGMKINRPQCVAKYTKDIVYARLTPGILKELEARNPVVDTGRRLVKHHQWLTNDIGHPALSQHLYAVTGLMRLANSWPMFMRLMNKAYPRSDDTMKQLEMFEDLEGVTSSEP